MTKVAAIQMCSSHIVDDNLANAAKLIAEAVENHAELIILPEMFAVMAFGQVNKVSEQELFGQGKIQQYLANLAKKHNIWLVGGTIPITSTDPNRVRASCMVWDNQGRCVARYDKIHLFDVVLSEKEIYQESSNTEPGETAVVVDTPFGKLGLAVCYDIRFPELFRKLYELGAEIVAVPTAFTVPTGLAHWEVLLRSRAIENFYYVIGACQGGTHSSGRKTYGHSLIIEPWGTIQTEQLQLEPGIIYGEIDLKKVASARRAIPSGEHRREIQ